MVKTAGDVGLIFIPGWRTKILYYSLAARPERKKVTTEILLRGVWIYSHKLSRR